jgi:glutaconate CoA-transferase, subunit A
MNNYPERKSKVISLEEAASWIKDGMTLGLGGQHANNAPNAFAREIIRKGVKDLTLIPINTTGYQSDILIGAGCVKKIYCSYVGFDHVGGAPNYRRAAESGEIEVVDLEELGLLKALRAGKMGYSFYPLPPGIAACDNININPDYYRVVKCPFTGVDVVCVAPLRPEITVVHYHKCDKYGNSQEGGHMEDFIAAAADKVIVTTDEVVPVEDTKANWKSISLMGFQVDAVVEVPFGCHPADSHGAGYTQDEKHMREYLASAKKGPEAFKEEYLDKYVYGCKNHAEYMQKIGYERLFELKTGRFS